MNRTVESRKDEWRTVNAEKYHAQTGDYANKVDRIVISGFVEDLSGIALDLPCGSGRMTPLLRSKFTTVSADYSPTMLEFASKDPDFLGARFDAFNLGLADNSFDLIHCLRLSFHYPNFKEILSEFHRILKPGGVLLFDSLNPWTLRWLLAFPLNLMRGRESRRVYFRSRGELTQMLRSRGFEVVQTETRYLLPTRSYRHLPRFLQKIMAAFEKIVPPTFRVLTYWKATKRERVT